VLDAATVRAEALMLGLRTDRGVPREDFLAPHIREVFDWGCAERLLADTGDRAVLTTRGRLLSNELFMRLLES
jgi:coproporphyrinogen III oxidase-like Fe-S oxidoreductase